MALRRFWGNLGLVFGLFALIACGVSPATVPSPLVEIPSALTVPQDLSIEVNDIQGTGGVPGLRFGSLVKLQTVTSSDIRKAILTAVGTIEETNQFLDLSLKAVNQREIPVDVSIVHFAYSLGADAGNVEIKFDFGKLVLSAEKKPDFNVVSE